MRKWYRQKETGQQFLSEVLVSEATGDKKKGFPNTLGCFQVTFDYFRSNPGGTHMTLWRWFGSLVCLAAFMVLVGGNLTTAQAQGLTIPQLNGLSTTSLDALNVARLSTSG